MVSKQTTVATVLLLTPQNNSYLLKKKELHIFNKFAISIKSNE